jgi:hypothetical protein
VYRKYKNIHDPRFSRHAQLTPALNLKMQYHLMYERTLAPQSTETEFMNAQFR